VWKRWECTSIKRVVSSVQILLEIPGDCCQFASELRVGLLTAKTMVSRPTRWVFDFVAFRPIRVIAKNCHELQQHTVYRLRLPTIPSRWQFETFARPKTIDHRPESEDPATTLRNLHGVYSSEWLSLRDQKRARDPAMWAFGESRATSWLRYNLKMT